MAMTASITISAIHWPCDRDQHQRGHEDRAGDVRAVTALSPDCDDAADE
jgi:hypothetical protein